MLFSFFLLRPPLGPMGIEGIGGGFGAKPGPLSSLRKRVKRRMMTAAVPQ